MTYNPFNKTINEPLEEADLLELINKSVSEGYYIEYKGSIFPANHKIGHSIASLANSYGGWYFVGVETDAANVANNIIGFDLNAYPDPIAKVREIVKSNIDPVPRFYIQQVNLAEPDRAVLVVYIPQEQDTPFVTKDGRIYRRTHDSSDPIPESNRYTVDRLMEEGQRTRKRFERFCSDERTFSRGEAENTNIGWLNIFIKPYSYEQIIRANWGKDELRGILQQSKENFEISLMYEGINIKGNLPFTSVYPTQKSIVLKQTQPYYSAFQGLTVELFFDGRAKFHIPVSFFNIDLREFNEHRLRANGIVSDQTIELFREISEEGNNEAGFQYLRFFDAGLLSMIISILSTFYLDWLKYDDGLITDLKLAVKGNGFWRSVPYFDDDEWADYIREFGFPVGKSSDIVFPEEVSQGFKIEANTKHRLGLILSEAVGLMFGFPTETQHLAFGHYLQKKYDIQQNQE